MKKFVLFIALFLGLGFTGWYVYVYLSDATLIYNKGISALHKNHYYTARLAFNFLIEEYPYSQHCEDAEKHLKDIEIIMKRYFVYFAASTNKKFLTRTQSDLKIRGIDSKIVEAKNFTNFKNDEFILLIEQFEKSNEAMKLADSLNKIGFKVFVKKAY